MTFNTDETGRILSINVSQMEPDPLPDGMTGSNFGEFVVRNGEIIHDPLPTAEASAEATVEERLDDIEAALIELAGLLGGE